MSLDVYEFQSRWLGSTEITVGQCKQASGYQDDDALFIRRCRPLSRTDSSFVFTHYDIPILLFNLFWKRVNLTFASWSGYTKVDFLFLGNWRFEKRAGLDYFTPILSAARAGECRW